MYDGATFTSVRATTAAPANASAPIEFKPASPAEIQALVYQAQQMRAAAIGALIADLIAGPVLRFRAWSENRATVQELQRLDDRMLADIGVTRDQINTLVDGALVNGRDTASKPNGLVQLFNDLIVEPARRWRVRARTRQELSALDDAMLRDIGIERGQIEGIAVAASEGKVSASGAAVPVGLALGWLDLPTPAVSNPANSNEARPRNFAIVDAAD
jgi:uncharacterized protein YjiS (DUF1127 family)